MHSLYRMATGWLHCGRMAKQSKLNCPNADRIVLDDMAYHGWLETLPARERNVAQHRVQPTTLRARKAAATPALRLVLWRG
jgi:hypothetical protein